MHGRFTTHIPHATDTYPTIGTTHTRFSVSPSNTRPSASSLAHRCRRPAPPSRSLRYRPPTLDWTVCTSIVHSTRPTIFPEPRSPSPSRAPRTPAARAGSTHSSSRSSSSTHLVSGGARRRSGHISGASWLFLRSCIAQYSRSVCVPTLRAHQLDVPCHGWTIAFRASLGRVHLRSLHPLCPSASISVESLPLAEPLPGLCPVHRLAEPSQHSSCI